uniref:EOG090X0EEC n=1 Tax=Moina brachiata TaxID=675436 RepID=A0A4Y7NK74_9CRUS|nr:EOG090X0EEC [Moina brachiata]SVE93283.1 EOG090X0EEC [Moina brachiata]
MQENITSNGGGTDSYNLVSESINNKIECLKQEVSAQDNRVIQVTNVAPQATKEQMQTLFGMIGKTEDLRLYPTMRELASPSQLRICFVKYLDSKDVPVALHLSNTVFIDRALNVSIYCSNELPDEYKGAEILSSVNSFGVVESKLPATLTNQIEGNPPNQVIRTLDPRLSIHNLPNYPLLPASTDSRRLEEIRRTVVAINLDSKVQAKEVMDFFASAGEIKYFRFCSKYNDDTRYAMMEFVEQESIVPALKLNNKQLGENIIKVHHSTQSIIKPMQVLSRSNAHAPIKKDKSRDKEEKRFIAWFRVRIDQVRGCHADKPKRAQVERQRQNVSYWRRKTCPRMQGKAPRRSGQRRFGVITGRKGRKHPAGDRAVGAEAAASDGRGGSRQNAGQRHGVRVRLGQPQAGSQAPVCSSTQAARQRRRRPGRRCQQRVEQVASND